jgi:hypothetical protein
MSYSKEQQMACLSFVAYCGMFEKDPVTIKDRVEKSLGKVSKITGNKKLVWGPAVHRDENLQIFIDSLMYVVQDVDNPGEFTVVVRGTNPFSASSWFFEDFIVWEQAMWDTGPALPDAMVAVCSNYALAKHVALTPVQGVPGVGQKLIQFLQGMVSGGGNVTFDVTGHSLGGVMSSTLALWLMNMQERYWPGKDVDISVYSFAGPTAGNQAFVDYSNETFNKNNEPRCFRFENKLDVATMAWDEDKLAGVETLYPGITPSYLEQKMIDAARKAAKGMGYKQIGVSRDIPAGVNEALKDYIVQALYQHVFPYLQFIDADILMLLTLMECLTGVLMESPLNAHVNNLLKKVEQKI